MSIFDIFKSKNKTEANPKPLPDINELTKNEIAITNSEEKPKVNESKFGGKPYLPADFQWPYYVGEDYDGVKKNRPLTFLAQIDLSEAHPFDRDGVLPDKGMLYFFYETETMKWGFDPEDKGCARVYYFEKTEGFTALNAPEELSDEFVIPEIRMSFGSGKSILSYEEMDIHIPSYDMDYDDYEKLLEKNGIENICERHKLLGYADLIQGEALSECEAVSRGIYMGSPEAYNKLSKTEKEDIKLHAADWVLLFQMASICDREPEVVWGDMGNLYFYIRKDDLKVGRFDRVQLTLQCG